MVMTISNTSSPSLWPAFLVLTETHWHKRQLWSAEPGQTEADNAVWDFSQGITQSTLADKYVLFMKHFPFKGLDNE